jgi:glutathione S-transferase
VAPEARDMKAVEASVSAAERFARILDAQLARGRFVSNHGFSTADIVNGCAAHRWLNLPIQRPSLPNLERWYAQLKARPGSRHVTSLALT